MQLGFLLSRHNQFVECARHNVPIVSDHTYEKDLIFAGLLLSGRELRLYEVIRRALKRPLKEPDLIVYLDAPDDILLQRIRLRNRPYEKVITARYHVQIREAYRRELLDRSNLRIICEDTSTVNLGSLDDMSALCDRILKNVPTEID